MSAEKFDYITHYKTDAEEFDYFEERIGPAKDEERRLHEIILKQIPKKTNLILDVGCGSGWLAKSLVKKGRKVISLDISKINPNRIHNELNSDNHFPIVSDSFRLPFKDCSVDCIVASEVLEHTFDPKGFVKELFRVLSKGGRIIISTPYKEKIRYHLCIHCNKKTPENAHLHSFDEKILKSLYESEDLLKFNSIIFGNKLLIFLRSYVILKFLPLSLWLIVDWLANKIYNKPLHIVCIYDKKS
ncbi:MAG: class I SAM-dependent methyltransferase [Ignavibacterium sp.]|nr:class I SAM-dependent methyltransferase [Ignavibacterium sp.]MDW8375840.1 class I SAM-dependent methyltransferase [Ignavibacteriales bacterium]